MCVVTKIAKIKQNKIQRGMRLLYSYLPISKTKTIHDKNFF